jgi:hypothetical protein
MATQTTCDRSLFLARLDRYYVLRWVLALITLAVVAPIVLYTVDLAHLYKQISQNRIHLPDRKYNELTKASIDIKVDQAKNLFQLSSLMIGIVWGLIFIRNRESRIVLGGGPERVMVTAATVAFLLQLACYIFFMNTVSDAYAAAGAIGGEKDALSIPDILDSQFGSLYWYQTYSAFVVILSAILAYFSAHNLKDITLSVSATIEPSTASQSTT